MAQYREHMFEKPLVSIVIPAYNAERFIGNALKQALNQTYRKVEVVVVNDGSSDRTEDIVRGFKDDRIKLISKRNEGVAIARNVGFSASSGAFVYFFDCDDYIPVYHIDELAKPFFSQSDLGLTYCDIVWLDSRGNNRFRQTGRSDNSGSFSQFVEKLFKGNSICPGAKMYSRKALTACGLYNPLLKMSEDVDLDFRISTVYLGAYVPKTALYYCKHGGGACDRNQMNYRFDEATRSFYSHILQLPNQDYLQKIYAKRLARDIAGHCRYRLKLFIKSRFKDKAKLYTVFEQVRKRPRVIYHIIKGR